MTVIVKQFTKEILFATLFVLLALVALFAFFDLIGQLDDVGTEYSLGTAFTLTALTLPSRVYEVMPLAALLAAVYIMSRWAARSEFTVLRVAGMSPWRLAKAMLVPGVILVAATYGFGELVSPWAVRQTLEVKSGYRSDVVGAKGYVTGVWVRDIAKNEAGETVNRFINVKNLYASSTDKTGAWRMFEFDSLGRMQRMIQAESATFEPNKGWHLHNATTVTYPSLAAADKGQVDPIATVRETDVFLASAVGPEILGVMTTQPDDMSMADLRRYLDHIAKTNQQTERYEIAFWTKVFYPWVVIVMLAISMPFAYLNARSGGMAVKIFAGVMIGIAFYAVNNLFSYLGIVNTWSPIAVSAAPSLATLLIAAAALYWVEKR